MIDRYLIYEQIRANSPKKPTNKELAIMVEVSERTIRNYNVRYTNNIATKKSGRKPKKVILTSDESKYISPEELKDMEDGVIVGTMKQAEDWANDLLDFEYDNGPVETMSDDQKKQHYRLQRAFLSACKREDRNPEFVLKVVTV
jgi:hypothetical protein